MNRVIARLAVVVLLAGCAAADEPSATVLSGSWGGPNMGVVASSDSAVVTLPCVTVSFQGAVQANQPAGFVNEGLVTAGSYHDILGTHTRMVVTISGQSAVAEFSFLNKLSGIWEPLTHSYTILLNQQVTFPEGHVCLV